MPQAKTSNKAAAPASQAGQAKEAKEAKAPAPAKSAEPAPQAAKAAKPQDLAALLREKLGAEVVPQDERQLQLYSQDIYALGELVTAVVRPTDTEQLAEAVRLANQQGALILPRGGGMSYTRGYLSPGGAAMLVDTGGMDQVVRIDQENMTVRVQTGCTWQKLRQALAPLGLRTPYWGTLSGSMATVGGSLSNNAIFWGSGRFGSAADSVLGLEVVTGDGQVLETGAGAQLHSKVSFMRQFGPDLTGLFLADCGALGIKTQAELPLLDEFGHHGYASFDFAHPEEMIAAMSEISRRGLATECCGFDPELQQQRMKRASLLEDLQMAGGVVRSSSPLQALASLAKLGWAGRRFVEGTNFTMHCIVSEHSAETARRHVGKIRAIAAANQGRPMADSIPRVMLANPFPPLNNVAGAMGERWAPIHGLFPHSLAQDAYRETAALFQRHGQAMQRHGISAGYLFATIGQQVSVLEPVFYWHDELQALHRQVIDQGVLKALPGFDASPEGRAQVEGMRGEIAQLYSSLGGAHLQIGRTYRYREGMPQANMALLEVLKKHLDPKGLMNPGVLGL